MYVYVLVYMIVFDVSSGYVYECGAAFLLAQTGSVALC